MNSVYWWWFINWLAWAHLSLASIILWLIFRIFNLCRLPSAILWTCLEPWFSKHHPSTVSSETSNARCAHRIHPQLYWCRGGTLDISIQSARCSVRYILEPSCLIQKEPSSRSLRLSKGDLLAQQTGRAKTPTCILPNRASSRALWQHGQPFQVSISSSSFCGDLKT